MSVNRVILLGYAGRDAEVKFTKSGTALCRFSLATNEKFKDRSGEPQEHTEWHSIVAWGRLGEIAGEFVTKGRQCYVEGKIRSRKWQNHNGEHKTFEITVSSIQFLSSSNGNGSKPKAETPQPAAAVPSEEDNPFRESGTADDEIPF